MLVSLKLKNIEVPVSVFIKFSSGQDWFMKQSSQSNPLKPACNQMKTAFIYTAAEYKQSGKQLVQRLRIIGLSIINRVNS